jgi:hypothetical protein
VETYRLTVTFAPIPGQTPGESQVIEATGGDAGQAPAGGTTDQPKDDGAYEEPAWNGGDGPVEEAHADIKGAGHR